MITSEAEILKLIDCLNSLHNGDCRVDLLVACGQDAIPHLQKYLMEGQPSHIYQPRQKAVNALARLGAKEVLIEYLCGPKEVPDPVVRFGEEAVENTAARALARWQTDDVFEVLLRIAETRTLPGVIEALASFRRQEPIPLFIAALMDDVLRPAAENALKAMGDEGKAALIEAVCASNFPECDEKPSITLSRRSALRILADMGVTEEEWSKLKELHGADDPEIAVSAARIALKIAGSKDKRALIQMLVRKIAHAGWYVQTEIEDCLVAHYDIAKEEIALMIAERGMQPETLRTSDRVLHILLNIRQRAEKGKNAG